MDGDGPGPHRPEFIDDIEYRLLVTERIFLKPTSLESVVVAAESLDCDDLTSAYEVLDTKGEPVFYLAASERTGQSQHFLIISLLAGYQTLTITRTGLIAKNYNVEGAGLLRFSQLSSPLGYTLRDTWKELVRIRTSWIGLCPCCLRCSRGRARMSVQDLDGTPTGSFRFGKWPELGLSQRTFSIHFIPNLDRKAKYMIFAASLTPFFRYFAEPGKRSRS